MVKGARFIKLLMNRKGSTSVIFVCSTIIIILLAAFVTDIGYIAIERYKLDRVIDRIAQMGAKALIVSKDECIRVINENAVKSISNISKLDINVSDNNREMSIIIERKLDYIFLKFIGFKDKKINSRVTAKVSNVTSYKGIRPFAINKTQIEYEKEYCLTTAGDKAFQKSNYSNYLTLIPVNTGSGNFATAILYGYNKAVYTGEVVYELPQSDLKDGNESISKLIEKCKRQPACTYDNYDYSCPRIIVLPVVDIDDKSKEDRLVVMGFTAFFIEDLSINKEDDRGIEIKGRFIKYTVDSNTSDGIPDFGLLGVKLKHW